MKRITGMVPLLVIITCTLPSCGFVSGQLHDKAMEEKLLKPGALDRTIAVPEKYPNYRYKFLKKYEISHDWYGGGAATRPNTMVSIML